MAMELGPLGVRVNMVSPGYMHTEMTEAAVGPVVLEHMLQRFDRVPMGRMVRADEVASACAFLASPEAADSKGRLEVVAIRSTISVAGVSVADGDLVVQGLVLCFDPR
jgi:NAD(P)-dependent dehydrogenase (short-subunit alcohol dehydrogenase family)